MSQHETSWSIDTKSPRGTRKLAMAMAQRLAPGSVIALVGQLGAGKTSFVQGLAEGLGVTDLTQVVSPTYTLVNEYPGTRLSLVHIDFYRLKDADAARALGLDEYLGRQDTVAAVEWADQFPDLVPPGAVWVELTTTAKSHRRVVVRGLARP